MAEAIAKSPTEQNQNQILLFNQGELRVDERYRYIDTLVTNKGMLAIDHLRHFAVRLTAKVAVAGYVVFLDQQFHDGPPYFGEDKSWP